MSLNRFAFLLGLALLAPAHVQAAPCAGFNDVDDTSPFCPSVEWIKNRGVTTGCVTPPLPAYCPADSVSRLQMAAFMNRLGTALTPLVLRAELVSGALDLDVSPVVCTTADQAITNFPRRAYVDTSLSGTSPGNVDIALRSVYSINGGASWQPITVVHSFAFVPGSQWGQASDAGVLDLSVGETVRFGLQVSRIGAGSADLSDSRCQLRAQIGSRDGATSPF